MENPGATAVCHDTTQTTFKCLQKGFSYHCGKQSVKPGVNRVSFCKWWKLFLNNFNALFSTQM